MVRELKIGGLDGSTFFAEDLALPILDDIAAMTSISDALDQSATERKGTAVVGRKDPARPWHAEGVRR